MKFYYSPLGGWLTVALLCVGLCSSCKQKKALGVDAANDLAKGTVVENCFLETPPRLADSLVHVAQRMATLARQQKNCMEYTIYQSVRKGEESRLSIVALWKNKKAYEEFRAEEAYRPLAIDMIHMAYIYQDLLEQGNGPTGLDDTEYRVICPMKVAGENLTELKELALELQEFSREDGGNLRYEFCQDTEDSTRCIFIETWTDQDALDDHSEKEHFERLVPQIEGLAEIARLDFLRYKDKDEPNVLRHRQLQALGINR